MNYRSKGDVFPDKGNIIPGTIGCQSQSNSSRFEHVVLINYVAQRLLLSVDSMLYLVLTIYPTYLDRAVTFCSQEVVSWSGIIWNIRNIGHKANRLTTTAALGHDK